MLFLIAVSANVKRHLINLIAQRYIKIIYNGKNIQIRTIDGIERQAL